MLTEDSLPREIAGIDDPLTLSVIDQAAYVLQRFEEKMNAGRLVQLLKGETSLAQAYIIFFGQIGWIKEDSPGHWQLTEKGRQTMKFLLPKDEESRQKKDRQLDPIVLYNLQPAPSLKHVWQGRNQAGRVCVRVPEGRRVQ